MAEEASDAGARVTVFASAYAAARALPPVNANRYRGKSRVKDPINEKGVLKTTNGRWDDQIRRAWLMLHLASRRRINS
jgi:hypothetical protein